MTNSTEFTFVAETPLKLPVPDWIWSSAPSDISPRKLQTKIEAVRKADWKLSWKEAEGIALAEMQSTHVTDPKEKKAEGGEKGMSPLWQEV
jgi:hypothetical protein